MDLKCLSPSDVHSDPLVIPYSTKSAHTRSKEMRFSIVLYFLLFWSCHSKTPTPSLCPHHDKVSDSLIHTTSAQFVNVYIDKDDAQLDKFPRKFIHLIYKPLTGLIVLVYVKTSNSCPSVMDLTYNFFLEHEPVCQNLCSVHRKYPSKFRFRISSDLKVGVVTSCVETTGQHSAWILSVANQSKGLSLEETLIRGKELLVLENITSLEFVAVDDPFSINYTMVSLWAADCLRYCTYNPLMPSETESDQSSLGRYSNLDNDDGDLKWSSNLWKIVVVAILILCVLFSYIKKRVQNRNVIAVLN